MRTSSPASPIRVLIVDDHRMVAEMLADNLAREADMDVVAHVGSAGEAEEVVIREEVDVALMVYRLPARDGLSALALIRAHAPEVRFLLLTANDNEDFLRQAVATGCAGYLSKEIHGYDALPGAVRGVHSGSTYFPPEMLSRLFIPPEKKAEAHGSELTPRELEVLRLMAQGVTNEEIGSALGISTSTVRNHTQSILEKLDAHSKLEAVTIALRMRLISLID